MIRPTSLRTMVGMYDVSNSCAGNFCSDSKQVTSPDTRLLDKAVSPVVDAGIFPPPPFSASSPLRRFMINRVMMTSKHNKMPVETDKIR